MTESRLVVASRKKVVGEEEGGKLITKRYKEMFRGMAVFMNETVEGVSLQYTYNKTQVFHFKYMHWTIYQLCLKEAVATFFFFLIMRENNGTQVS